MSKVLQIKTKNWSLPFYSSTGRKWLIKLQAVVSTFNNDVVWPAFPASVVEKKDDIYIATYPDMSTSIFVSLSDVAAAFDSGIIDSEVVEDYGN